MADKEVLQKMRELGRERGKELLKEEGKFVDKEGKVKGDVLVDSLVERMKECGREDLIDSYVKEATYNNYENVINVTVKYGEEARHGKPTVVLNYKLLLVSALLIIGFLLKEFTGVVEMLIQLGITMFFVGVLGTTYFWYEGVKQEKESIGFLNEHERALSPLSLLAVKRKPPYPY